MHGHSCSAAFVTFGSTGYFGATAHEPARKTPANARAGARQRAGTHARRTIGDDRASMPRAKQLSSLPPAQLSNYVE
ncbi:hypothetical protein WS76_16820 [Burkholderia humptydooensis]|nr:hypothetical protein WS76_16820 [Burkholderia humptydooensis]